MWWFTPVIPALRLRQNHEIEVSLGYIVRLSHKRKPNKTDQTNENPLNTKHWKYTRHVFCIRLLILYNGHMKGQCIALFLGNSQFSGKDTWIKKKIDGTWD
jgi:hypothetical protein